MSQCEKLAKPVVTRMYVYHEETTIIHTPELLQNGRTPLYLACEKNYVEVAQLLLKMGAQVDISATVSVYVLLYDCDYRPRTYIS